MSDNQTMCKLILEELDNANEAVDRNVLIARVSLRSSQLEPGGGATPVEAIESLLVAKYIEHPVTNADRNCLEITEEGSEYLFDMEDTVAQARERSTNPTAMRFYKIAPLLLVFVSFVCALCAIGLGIHTTLTQSKTGDSIAIFVIAAMLSGVWAWRVADATPSDESSDNNHK